VKICPSLMVQIVIREAFATFRSENYSGTCSKRKRMNDSAYGTGKDATIGRLCHGIELLALV